MSAPWGLLGTPEKRAPWETYLHGKGIETVAIDRAPLHSLHEVVLTLIVDTDFNSHITQKIWLFEGHMDPSAPVLGNLAAASAAKLTSLCKHPERVAGFACCPPLGTYGIEFSRTELTSDECVTKAKTYLSALGLTIEEVGDRAGGVLSRTLAMLVNEACFALQEGLAPATELDLAMKYGVNYPKGLVEWGDFIGIEYLLDVLDGIYADTRDPRYRASAYLRRKAELGLPLHT